MIYLTNAFSLTMTRYPVIGVPHMFSITRISAKLASRILRKNRFVSCYGHENTAWHLRRYLGIDFPVVRQAINLREEDTMLVARAEKVRDFESGRLGAPKWSFYIIRMEVRRGKNRS